MALTIGTQLGSYEISALLGKGGMGEVYRARDSKLKREVAIKVLPEEFARDADRVGRFQREAEVLATLNHPNIAAIYDVQEVDSTRLLVLELVDGETLAERIQRGPIPVEEALQIAGHIGEALEAAHEKGIVHRDLKPANVKITPEGKVKVLDFGLAKAMEGSTATVALSNSPTLVNTFAATNAGLIIGTAAYMSPEQTRGISVDHRTDIWAFGCVLYEMLTARQAFKGELVSDVLASVLARDVDYTLLHPHLHPRLKNAISRCLEKDRKRRWQAMGDVRVEIQDVVADPFGSKLLAPRALDWPLWKRTITVAVTAIVVAASTLAITSSFRTSPPANVVRFSFAIPEGQRFNRGGGRHVIAISPAGDDIAYVAGNQLFVRKLSEMDSRRIQGTDDPVTPFFSPDGQWLAFYSVSESKLKKVAISGGAPVTIAETPNPIGASWSVNDQIFIGATSGGVLRVAANGGKPETVIKIEADEEAQSPQLLSDGENVLFTLTKATVDRSLQIAVQSLKTGRRQVLLDGGSDARYVPTGHIVYGVASNVLAVPFDIKSLRLTGGPVPVLEGVAYSPTRALMQMGVSNEGTMIYVADGGFGSGGRVFVLTDSMGQTKALPFAGGLYFHPRISPNGKQLVIASDDGKDASIWLYDLDGSTSLRRLTFGSANRFPIWSPDGQRVVFQSDRETDLGLFWQRADGSGTPERLTTAEGKAAHFPQAWTPDGRALIFSSIDGRSNGSLWSVSVEPGSKPKLLIEGIDPANQSASLSTDGHWIAYTGSELGRKNVFVQPFPPTGAKYQITTEGGISPIWSPDNKQLIYSQNPGSGIGNLMSIDVQTRPSLAFGNVRPFPIKGFWHNGAPGAPRGFDMTPDGKQFIVMRSPDEANSRLTQQINFVLNWFTELQQRVPVK